MMKWIVPPSVLYGIGKTDNSRYIASVVYSLKLSSDVGIAGAILLIKMSLESEW